ncbi:MAG: hypothetical protein ABI378_10465 [Chitinophagaceae bacterium]
MKTYALLLLAVLLVGLASCGNNRNTTTEAQIDSTANAKTDSLQAAMKMRNDSLINAMALAKADSATNADSLAKVAAFNSGKAASSSQTTSKTTNTTTTKTTETTKPESNGNGKPKMSGGK